MNNQSENPPVSRLLRFVTAFESVVLVVSGGGLFLLPSFLTTLWPWDLTPFNTRLLGAIYLASLVSTIGLVVVGRWSPARVVMPMILAFTVIVLIVSTIYLSHFTVLFSTVLWFILYVGIPLNVAYHMWLYRKLPPVEPVALPSVLRGFLLVQGVVFLLYGVAMLIAPVEATSWWPWTLDDFHGRMYSVVFITPAVGLLLVTRAASKLDLLTGGLTAATGGLLSVVGLFIVNAEVNRVDFSQAGTWLWIGLFASMVVSGVLLVWQSRR